MKNSILISFFLISLNVFSADAEKNSVTFFPELSVVLSDHDFQHLLNEKIDQAKRSGLKLEIVSAHKLYQSQTAGTVYVSFSKTINGRKYSGGAILTEFNILKDGIIELTGKITYQAFPFQPNPTGGVSN